MDHNIRTIALWAPFRGKVGTEFANLQYARTLRENGYDVLLISLLDEYDEYKDEFKVVSLWSEKLNWVGKSNILYRRDFFLLALFSVGRLSAVLQKYKVDIVISSLLSNVACKATQRTNKKLIISIQGYPKFLLENDNFLSSVENYVRRNIWQKNYTAADKLISMTTYTANKLSVMFPSFKEKLLHISNPLFDKNTPIKPTRPCHCKTRKIVFVGRYSYQKDFNFFASVAAKFATNQSISFEVFGEFPSAVVSAHRDKNIIFHGYKKGFWDSLCPCCTIHLVTSRWEDPGHAMLESIKNGIITLVVNSDAPHVEVGMIYGAHVVTKDELPTLLNRYLADLNFFAPPSTEERQKLVNDYGMGVFGIQLNSIINSVKK